MRHSVWGLAGAGQGVAEAADTGMRLMAAGVGGTLVRRASARLGYEADGFSLGMDGGIGVSCVRAGLEGSVTLQDVLEPYVEAAVLRGRGERNGNGGRRRVTGADGDVACGGDVKAFGDASGGWLRGVGIFGHGPLWRNGGLGSAGATDRGRTHVGTLWQSERPWDVYSGLSASWSIVLRISG